VEWVAEFGTLAFGLLGAFALGQQVDMLLTSLTQTITGFLCDRLSVCVDGEKREAHKCAESNLSHTLLASHQEKLFIFSPQ